MKQQGLTLVELMISLAVFAIIMLALSGTIVQGLQLRRSNSLESQALAYSASVLENYKSFWSDKKKFDCFASNSDECAAYTSYFAGPTIPPVPTIFQNATTQITIECVDINGTVSASCPSEIPDLRRVTVTLVDSKGKINANLMTEIGNPLP